MFNIAMDTCGATCDADELVRGKSVVEIENARKRKYFCVACAGEKHAVSLNVRRDAKARNYTALAWFSHHGGGGGGNSQQDTPLPETARHWQAKHILSKHVGRYFFTVSKCRGCNQHTTVEDGAGATGRVEFSERTPDGTLYRFDAALVCGDPGSVVVRSVLEVWATHETSAEKQEYCRESGYMFGEFDAAAVVSAHTNAPEDAVYALDNLKIRVFECRECVSAREEAALRVEKTRLLAAAAKEKERVLAEARRVLEEETRLLAVAAKEKERVLAEARRVLVEAEEAHEAREREAWEMRAKEDGTCPIQALIRQNHDHWLATQVDVQRKRRERDEASHQRWVRARAGVPGECSKRGATAAS